MLERWQPIYTLTWEKFWNNYFQRTPVFSEWKIECFWNKKPNVMGQLKPRFSFWLKIYFWKTASNKHFDLRKLESVVRSKWFPEDIPKVKGKKANSRILKSLRALKYLMDV